MIIFCVHKKIKDTINSKDITATGEPENIPKSFLRNWKSYKSDFGPIARKFGNDNTNILSGHMRNQVGDEIQDFS